MTILMEDRALLSAFRAGESAALERVYRHHVDAVSRFLRGGFSFSSGGKPFRFIGYRSSFVLQDAVQETFFKAFAANARESYSGLRPYQPYLQGIARNLVIDDFRRRSRELELFVPEGASGSPLDGLSPERLEGSPIGEWTRRRPSPEQEAIKGSVRAAVAAFLEDLGEGEHMTLIELLYIENLSQQVVAEKMGVDRNHVRKLVRELRLRLLRFMKSRGEIDALDPRELLTALTLVAVMVGVS